MSERRLLQAAILLACLVPLLAGGAGMVLGQTFLARHAARLPDLDSHVRYLSGLLFAIGLAYLTCIAGIERKGARMGLLSALVVVGGLARLGGILAHGWPGPEHSLALGMELGVVPALWWWQRRIAARAERPGAATT